MKQAVLILINALHSGGAEKTCLELARRLGGEYDVEVVGLLIGGPAEQELRDAGVSVTVMHALDPWRQLVCCWRLARLMRQKKPKAVITFLYFSDLVGGILARMFVPRVKVFWNIRNNLLSRNQAGLASHVVSRLNAVLSRMIPTAIVYCSAAARVQHEAIGFVDAHSCVIENSSLSVRFTFDERKRAAFRGGRCEQDFVFLFVGRFAPVKRVDLFVEACSRLYQARGGNIRFVIAGRDMDTGNESLMQEIGRSRVAERFDLLGHVSDQQLIFSAADCLVVTSESEGSPNTVYEAMATGLPTVILATVGTEHLAGVHRLPTRRIEDLVDAMGMMLTRGIPSPASRLRPVNTPVEHPLVAYYRGALRCR